LKVRLLNEKICLGLMIEEFVLTSILIILLNFFIKIMCYGMTSLKDINTKIISNIISVKKN